MAVMRCPEKGAPERQGRLCCLKGLAGGRPVSAKEYLAGRRRAAPRPRQGTRTALYLRVSTADQKPDLQYDGLRGYAARAGLDVEGVRWPIAAVAAAITSSAGTATTIAATATAATVAIIGGIATVMIDATIIVAATIDVTTAAAIPTGIAAATTATTTTIAGSTARRLKPTTATPTIAPVTPRGVVARRCRPIIAATW